MEQWFTHFPVGRRSGKNRKSPNHDWHSLFRLHCRRGIKLRRRDRINCNSPAEDLFFFSYCAAELARSELRLYNVYIEDMPSHWIADLPCPPVWVKFTDLFLVLLAPSKKQKRHSLACDGSQWRLYLRIVC